MTNGPDMSEWSIEKMNYYWFHAEEHFKDAHPEWDRVMLYYRVSAVKNRIAEEIVRRNDNRDLSLEEIENFLKGIGI